MGGHAKPTAPGHVWKHMHLVVRIVVAPRRLFPDGSVEDCRVKSLEQRMLGTRGRAGLRDGVPARRVLQRVVDAGRVS